MREAGNEGSDLYRYDNNTRLPGFCGNNPTMVVRVRGTRPVIEMRTSIRKMPAETYAILGNPLLFTRFHVQKPTVP